MIINYYLLTKPGIILGNLMTVATGFLLATHASFEPTLFFATLFGLTFIIASACVFNNIIDRYNDQKMERTKDRPMAKGLISGENAILFGTILVLAGSLILYAYTNVLTLLIAEIGFLFYVVIYSYVKGHTVYGTAIGSIAGATPPLVGYCAVKNQFDVGAIILFLIMVFWQMPHFYAIAIYRAQDYKAANIPVLPLIKGLHQTKLRMILYIIAFICSVISLEWFNFTGKLFLWGSLFFSLTWLFLGLQGIWVKAEENERWAHNMFRFSLVTITSICLLAIVNHT